MKVGFIKKIGHHYGPELFWALDIENYTSFCTVRNHWDAIVSWWFFKGQNLVSELIDEQWLTKFTTDNPQYFKFPNMWWFIHEVPNVHILRYERYYEDIEELFTFLDLPMHKVPSVLDLKYKRDRNFRRYFTPDARDKVFDLFGKEITTLGYSWYD